MKTIKVKWCGGCPFINSDYDDYAVGHSTIDSCNLMDFFGMKSNISVHDNIGTDPDIKTPNNCPLKSENFSIIFEPFTPEEQNEISLLKEQIKVLEEECCELFEDNPEYLKKNDELMELYKKLNKLQYENN